MLITLSSTVSGQEWLTILQSKIPSVTASYRLRPESARGRMCWRLGSSPRLVLIQSEKASCSSTLTECVVPVMITFSLRHDLAMFDVLCKLTSLVVLQRLKYCYLRRPTSNITNKVVTSQKQTFLTAVVLYTPNKAVSSRDEKSWQLLTLCVGIYSHRQRWPVTSRRGS